MWVKLHRSDEKLKQQAKSKITPQKKRKERKTNSNISEEKTKRSWKKEKEEGAHLVVPAAAIRRRPQCR